MSNPGAMHEQLSQAGSVIDKAIEYMTTQNIGQFEIASALLGGALAMLARSMPDDSVVAILQSAIESVKTGELRRDLR